MLVLGREFADVRPAHYEHLLRPGAMLGLTRCPHYWQASLATVHGFGDTPEEALRNLLEMTDEALSDWQRESMNRDAVEQHMRLDREALEALCSTK